MKQFIITTKDGTQFVKFIKPNFMLTNTRTLAMRFKSKREAERMLLLLGGDYLLGEVG